MDDTEIIIGLLALYFLMSPSTPTPTTPDAGPGTPATPAPTGSTTYTKSSGQGQGATTVNEALDQQANTASDGNSQTPAEFAGLPNL